MSYRKLTGDKKNLLITKTPRERVSIEKEKDFSKCGICDELRVDERDCSFYCFNKAHCLNEFQV